MRAHASVAICVFAWAAAFPLIRIGIETIAPLPLSAGRFAIGGIVFAIWAVRFAPSLPTRRDALRFLACGASGVAGYTIFLSEGEQTVPAGATSLIIATVPLITVLLSTLLGAETLSPRQLGGLLLSFAGAGIVLLTQRKSGGCSTGCALILGAALCQAIYFVLLRPLVALYGALACTAYTLLAGGLLLAPWLPLLFATISARQASMRSLLALAALGLLSTVAGYATWTHALGRFGAARASHYLYAVPPLAVALSVVMTGEALQVGTIGGGALALLGVVVGRAR